MKKRSKKKLTLYILLAIFSLCLAGVIVWLGFKFSPNREPYVIIPSVLGFLITTIVCIFALLKIYPYAVEYDKKKLKKKTFKCQTLTADFNELKNNAGGRLGKEENGKLIKIVSASAFRPQVVYTFEFEAEEESIFGGSHRTTPVDRERAVGVYFIEIENYTDQFEKLERALDRQYIAAWYDPYRVVIPIIYERSTNKIYYYEKWSKLNFTLLAFATNHVKKILFE